MVLKFAIINGRLVVGIAQLINPEIINLLSLSHLIFIFPSSEVAATKGKVVNMVGLDDDAMEIVSRLVTGPSSLQVISITGTGGIGKTTLAQKTYNHSSIVNYFDVRAWVIVSLYYHKRQIIIDLLDSMGYNTREMHTESTEQLEFYLHKRLADVRYLIVMEDVWDTSPWEDLRRLFPDNGCGSRLLVTTRQSSVAQDASSYHIHEVRFLNQDESWQLFCDKVFGEDHCPYELEEIGKEIARKCHGLPLALIVVGGLLSGASKTPQYWRDVANKLSSLESSSDDEYLNMLSLSYTNLPLHLKKCLLYFGIFPKKFSIRVSKLVKLWVAEGFVEQVMSKTLEDVAYEYLLDLVGRSLVTVGIYGTVGKIKTCKMHDLIREFCIDKAKMEIMFLHISDRTLYNVKRGSSLSYLTIYRNTTSTLISDDGKLSSLHVSALFSFDQDFNHSIHHLNPRPLIVLDTWETSTIGVQAELNELLVPNLRYLACSYDHKLFSISSSSVLPDLQTLILHPILTSFPRPVQVPIWNMPQLRHVQMKTLSLPDSVEGGNTRVLENLQTLSRVQNFRCSLEILERIPNLRKLGITYFLNPTDWQNYCLHNLVLVKNLETLKCLFLEPSPSFLRNLTFPPSLIKLTLEGCGLPWEDMWVIGSLPNLEVLKLKYCAFEGPKWELAEEGFPELKYLLLEQLSLEHWEADSYYFPRLEYLIIRYCENLKIPSAIGYIPTLKLIEVNYCADSVVASVKEIQEEQFESGNEDLQVRIHVPDSQWLNQVN